MTNWASVFVFAVGLFAATPSFAQDCPLNGRWDTGFVTKAGSHYTKMIHSFDCTGHTVMDVTFLRGRFYSGGGERYHRSGRYTVVGPNLEIPGALNVDIIIDTFTISYLDQNSVAQALDTAHNDCTTTNPQLLVPQSILTKRCDDVIYPRAGDIERAVVLVNSDRLFWSEYAGPNKLVVQPPNQAVRRQGTVDMNRIFLKVTP